MIITNEGHVVSDSPPPQKPPLSLERLKTLSQRIALMSEEQHRDVMKIVEQADAAVSTNDNGVFVDMCSLPEEIIQELEQLVQLTQVQMQIKESQMSSFDANTTGEASKRWDCKIDSKAVFDRAEELVKRHLYRGDYIQKDVTKRKTVAKKNFLCSSRKCAVYEPQLNELDEV